MTAKIKERPINILQGRTFTLDIYWESDPIIYKPITGISLDAGPPRLLVVGHGCPDGWEGAVTRVKGMTQINAENSPPDGDDYHSVTVLDVDHIEFNDVDASGFAAWLSGGFFQYNTPVNLTGYTARMKIKDRIGGTVLASTEVADAPKNILAITINVSAHKMTLKITATATEAIAWKKGVYDIEMVSASGDVTLIMVGPVGVSREVTTP